MNTIERLAQKLPNLRYGELLSKYTTIGLGGEAKALFVAEDIDGLAQAVIAAKELEIPYRVIGYGSDILFSDLGFKGLVIINRSNNVIFDEARSRVIADSGAALSRLISEAASRGLCGLEPLYGIPGTVGGAIFVNAGSHGSSIADFLRNSSVLTADGKVVNAKDEWFGFAYRSSKLKHKKNNFPPVILNGIFQLQRCKREVALDRVAHFKALKEQNQPLGERTCGSVFKNPAGSDNTTSEGSKEQSAGYLLDQSGAKKLKKHGLIVSKKHANWIINKGSSSAKDARTLIEEMRNLVDEKYKVTLEEEVEYLGDWDV
jgi:UDP-N-acetylmuramate dehydrogenase